MTSNLATPFNTLKEQEFHSSETRNRVLKESLFLFSKIISCENRYGGASTNENDELQERNDVYDKAFENYDPKLSQKQ